MSRKSTNNYWVIQTNSHTDKRGWILNPHKKWRR